MSLSPTQRRHFEDRLREERTGHLTKVPFHFADLGTDTMNQELEASNAARQTSELAEIDAALERL